MMNLPAISLNANWTCEYFELEPGLYEFMNDVPVPSLVAWSFDKARPVNWGAYLSRSFELRPTESCISYLLYLDSAPAQAQIYVNGEPVGEYTSPGPDAPPFELDITNYVALGENRIGFRVAGDAPGGFSGVRLQAVACA